MAKVFAPPSGFPKAPEFGQYLDPANGNFDSAAYSKACEQWLADLCKVARQQAPLNPLVGNVIRFGVADGFAQYVVWKTKPLTLIHVDLYDGYAIPAAHARGLTLADVKQQVKRLRFLAERP